MTIGQYPLLFNIPFCSLVRLQFGTSLFWFPGWLWSWAFLTTLAMISSVSSEGNIGIILLWTSWLNIQTIYFGLYVFQSDVTVMQSEMEWVQYKCTRVRVRLIWTCMSTSTQKTNVLEYEYDYFTIYSSTSTITLECNHDYFHDYFHEYSVSNIKATFMESLGVILVVLFCH